MSDLIERLGPKYYKCWMLDTRKEAAAEIERLRGSITDMDLVHDQAKEIERLINKTEIDKITMDNFLGQMRKLQAELKQANAVVEALQEYMSARYEVQDGYNEWTDVIEALAALETDNG